jgi:hypothetical protein
MDQTLGPNEKPSEDDSVIRGADAIAEYIFGDRSHRRKVYYLAERTRLPIHRLASQLCLRKSAYKHWIETQEKRSAGNADKPVS